MRERAVAALPPEKLLADEQPSYVASWIYVFGVLSLASLSGCGLLDLGGSGRDPHVFLETDRIGTGEQALFQERR